LPLLKKCLPWLGFARYPVKFVVITIFCLPLLAASGVVWLQDHPGPAARRALLTAGLITSLGIACVLIVSRRFPFFGEDFHMTWQSGWTRFAFLWTALAILLRPWPHATRAGRLLAGSVFLLLTGADICTHTPRQNPTAAVQAYDDFTPSMSAVPRLGRSRALVSPREDAWLEHLATPTPLGLYLCQRTMLFKDCNLLDRIPKADGFFSLCLRRQDQVAALLAAHDHLPGLLEFLGVSQLGSTNKLLTWEPQPRFMPMATIGQQPVFVDDSAALRALAAPDFKPRDIVYLPPEARHSVSATADRQAAILSSRVMDSACEFETEASHPTMLVVAQTWYHPWVAEIDGRAAPLWRANYDFQAVPLPAGRHAVRLAYKDTLFHLGVVISIVSMILCALAAIALPPKDRNTDRRD
jgi:hypothetical protein